MLYYGGRRQEGTTAYDSGAQIRDVIKGFARWGACSEEIWPYDLSLLTVQPSVEAYEAGVGDTGISYARLPDPSFSSSDAVIDALRAALTAGNPFVFGSSIYESFESAKVAADGVVPLPGPNERLIGTHCMVGAGHDDASRMFIVPNSWGPRWGHEGCALIPYEYMGKQGLTADFWHIDLIGRSPDAAAIPVAA